MNTVVVDTSVWADALLPGPRRETARTALADYATVAAPEHLRLELTQVLRRYARNDLGEARAAALITVVAELPVETVPTSILLPRIWHLRDSLSAYDAAYLAAAEHLDVPLLTRDSALLGYSPRAYAPHGQHT